MIRFDKVSKVYSGGHQALQKVSFHLRKGEMAFLTGHSGAGKSTLLRLLAGEIQPDSGTVELGETVRIGHFSQEGRELDLNQRVYDCIH